MLVARGVSKKFGARPVLEAVDLDVRAGELLAITGSSGAGKSTLLHCLSGITRPDAGSVRFGTSRVNELGDAARSRLRRTDFGVLLQAGHLVAELSAAENVALPLLLEGCRRVPALNHATAVLDRFDVADLADEKPAAMSGGQCQRVALARAVVTDPAVLFADEPTGSLDSVSGRRVVDELVALAGSGTTVVLVTHDVEVAARADRVVVLRDGALVGVPVP